MTKFGNLTLPEGFSMLEATAGNSGRIVTPTDPLIINATKMKFDKIEIKGGTISTVVETTVEINDLTKTS
jgi:hypothetical protein